MTRTKLLFVCSRNQWRSPTAERIYAHSPHFDVRSRGVSKSAVRRLTVSDIAWADVIFAMEPTHKTRIVSVGIRVRVRARFRIRDSANL